MASNLAKGNPSQPILAILNIYFTTWVLLEWGWIGDCGDAHLPPQEWGWKVPPSWTCKVEEGRTGWAGVGAPHFSDAVDSCQTGVITGPGIKTQTRASSEVHHQDLSWVSSLCRDRVEAQFQGLPVQQEEPSRNRLTANKSTKAWEVKNPAPSSCDFPPQFRDLEILSTPTGRVEPTPEQLGFLLVAWGKLHLLYFSRQRRKEPKWACPFSVGLAGQLGI